METFPAAEKEESRLISDIKSLYQSDSRNEKRNKNASFSEFFFLTFYVRCLHYRMVKKCWLNEEKLFENNFLMRLCTQEKKRS